LHRTCPVVVAARRHDEPAAAYAEVERLVKAFGAVLEQHILASDPEIGRPVLHVGRNVRRAQDDERNSRLPGRDDQLARRTRVLRRNKPRSGKQGQRFVEDAPLGEGDGQRGHGGGKCEPLDFTGVPRVARGE
jgi:hypothetical protein